MLEDHDLVKLGRLLGDGLDVVIVPVGEFASTAESAWEKAPCWIHEHTCSGAWCAP